MEYLAGGINTSYHNKTTRAGKQGKVSDFSLDDDKKEEKEAGYLFYGGVKIKRNTGSVKQEMARAKHGKTPKLMDAYLKRSENHRGDTFEEYVSYLKKVMDIK